MCAAAWLRCSLVVLFSFLVASAIGSARHASKDLPRDGIRDCLWSAANEMLRRYVGRL